jgi:hypothetical protein
MIAFMAKPANLKGFFRYRWMMNYLSVPDFVDRHTEGLRGAQLRIAHKVFDFIVEQSANDRHSLSRGTLCGMDPGVQQDRRRVGREYVVADHEWISNRTWLPQIRSSTRRPRDAGGS